MFLSMEKKTRLGVNEYNNVYRTHFLTDGSLQQLVTEVKIQQRRIFIFIKDVNVSKVAQTLKCLSQRYQDFVNKALGGNWILVSFISYLL